METSREYREFAEQCDRLAQEWARTDDQRNTLRKIAEAWRQVANQSNENVLSRPR
jgi:hypothetical protein